MNSRLAANLFGSDASRFFAQNGLRFLEFAKPDGSPDSDDPKFKHLVRYFRDQPRPKWLGGNA